ncbi:hypothetical protein EVAR_43881_1 [Eumeta japonica]|uniref:Uncharacterized protein n=1 Tax=Eumeta variegata TaxID=151549 RepID=A0A4C1WP93_EUMVA|nr:hypothetical protein EVAR_43881_1 [Eumeta japonica]
MVRTTKLNRQDYFVDVNRSVWAGLRFLLPVPDLYYIDGHALMMMYFIDSNATIDKIECEHGKFAICENILLLVYSFFVLRTSRSLQRRRIGYRSRHRGKLWDDPPTAVFPVAYDKGLFDKAAIPSQEAGRVLLIFSRLKGVRGRRRSPTFGRSARWFAALMNRNKSLHV